MRVFKTMRKKLKSKRGFTLVELLASLMIVVMMSLMMSVGVSVGASVQRESAFVAQSDMLSSTINTALSDVLRYATVETILSSDEDYGELVNKSILFDEEGNRRLISNTSYGISNGAVVLNQYGDDVKNKRVAIWQYVYGTLSEDGEEAEETGAQDQISYLVSHGMYTNLMIEKDADDPFITYIMDDSGKEYYYVHYWVKEKNAAKPLTKEVETYFRIANE